MTWHTLASPRFVPSTSSADEWRDFRFFVVTEDEWQRDARVYDVRDRDAKVHAVHAEQLSAYVNVHWLDIVCAECKERAADALWQNERDKLTGRTSSLMTRTLLHTWRAVSSMATSAVRSPCARCYTLQVSHRDKVLQCAAGRHTLVVVRHYACTAPADESGIDENVENMRQQVSLPRRRARALEVVSFPLTKNAGEVVGVPLLYDAARGTAALPALADIQRRFFAEELK